MANFDSPDMAFSSKEGYGEDSGLAVYVAQAIDPISNGRTLPG
uniref:Uncharacterized protein n=1 Tax=Anguilla anguilla TaxID=7936 RepID=A0A0E9QVP8_ANGAN